MKKRSVQAKDACDFVAREVFNKMLNIGISSDFFLLAAADEGGEFLEKMQLLLFNFVGRVFVGKNEDSERAEARFRKWMEIVDIPIVFKILSYFGFEAKTEVFDIENSSRDCLLALGFLMWRTDVFSMLYKPLLPHDDTYLPPYGALTDEDVMPDKEEIIPDTIDSLLKRIQRQSMRIPKKLHVLSDIELDCDNYRALIQEIDGKSTLYELSLKSNPKLLNDHITALKEANKNEKKIEKIAKYEEAFYQWLTKQADKKLKEFPEQGKNKEFDFDFFPSMTQSPATRMTQRAEMIQKRMEGIDEIMKELKEKKTAEVSLPKNETKEIDARIESFFNSLNNLEHIEVEKEKEKHSSMIPDFNFSSFSDKMFKTIIDKCDNESEEMKVDVIKQLEERIDDLCKRLGLEYAGIHAEDPNSSIFLTSKRV